MKILLTGSSGTIGKEILSLLRSDGHIVNTLSFIKYWDTCNLNIDFDSIDWGNYLTGVDIVIHLAAFAHSRFKLSTRNVAQIYSLNTLASGQIAIRCAAYKIKKYIYISSANAYDLSMSGCQNDKSFRLSSSSLYADTKYKSEQLILSVAKVYPLVKYIIIRPSLVYGPNCKGNFEILLRLLSVPFPLPLRSLPMKRDFIYIENLVHIVREICCRAHVDGLIFDAYDADQLTFGEFLHLISSALHRKSLVFSASANLNSILLMILRLSPFLKRVLSSSPSHGRSIYEILNTKQQVTTERAVLLTVRGWKDRLSNQASGYC